ncbi:hypothetical protein Flexsi_0587 [Flexistipes sinusarabici DSM 4947]|uniref:NAD/GMP synthase domain-containing protein n=1 Tax=Flexistipes sinusarabici (strain ATCC 49648 / DSM 4947 / MAS 10) TaxID=717231 RepID=F8E9T3_FLESM|nr:asparagine synthase-related protein [Flexistipes sinusarabici]AEI14266.1 hypothetical protein Flexsi_0587 [Flexistipes sinusarabici DSM 4947]
MKYFKNYKSCIVALSGGIDSAAVLKLAVDEMGADNVAAATCINSHVFNYEIKNAELIANTLGVKWYTFTSTPSEEFFENVADKCYYCKKSVIAEIFKIAEKYGYQAVCDGSNKDDLDDYRPGMKILNEYGVFSPLLEAEMGKKDAETIAGKICNAEIFFNTESCAATRIKTGRITEARLEKIEKIEDKLRYNYPGIRVRDYGETAKIEFKIIKHLTRLDREIIENVVRKFFENVEFGDS